MKKTLFGIAGFAAIYAGYAFYSTKQLGVTNYTVRSFKIPMSFHGKQFVQLSDLHSATFGRFNNDLLKTIRKLEPDGVFITGDLIDGDEPLHVAIALIRKLSRICPLYYVPGNHEAKSAFFEELLAALAQAGVHILDQSHTFIENETDQIAIAGVFDPKFNSYGMLREDDEVKEEIAKEVAFLEEGINDALAEIDDNVFTILLAHRPEYWNIYQRYAIDLTLTGHAHGGQIRLPFTEGLFAPGQGYLPKLTNGIHEKDGKRLIISRGLGNSVAFVPRVHNRPELILITLEHLES